MAHCPENTPTKKAATRAAFRIKNPTISLVVNLYDDAKSPVQH